MKFFTVFTGIFIALTSSGLHSQTLDQIQKLEAAGDVAGARAVLARAVDAEPGNIPALTRYAEFLDGYGDPGCCP